MELKLDSDDVKQFAAASIIGQLGEEGQAKIIEQAVRSILTPNAGTSYGQPRTTPLQDAFDSAVRAASWEVARDVVNERPEFRAAIRAEMVKVIDEIMAGDDFRAEQFRRIVRESLLEAMNTP